MNHAAPANAPRTVLHGSTHVPLHGEEQKGRTDPNAEISVTLLLRRRNELPDLHAEFGTTPLHRRQHIAHEKLATEHGTASADIAAAERFAREHHLEVCRELSHHRSLVLKGTAAAIEHAFQVELVDIEHHRGSYRAATAPASVPGELDGIVQNVLGISTRPCARRPIVHRPNSTKPLWTAPEMARAYGLPPHLSAARQTIALIELGGGYHEDDLRTFFRLLQRPMPNVRCVSIHGVRNSPAPVEHIRQFLEVVEGKRKLSDVPADVLSAAQCTVEVTMDIELAAAFAPGADIVVYMAPATEQGIFSAVSRAISHTETLPSAISISWGEPEAGVSKAYMHSVDGALREAAMLGITVCVSSGDEGAMNGETKGEPAVNFPASSPHVLSCGGTSVQHADDSILRESVWNSSVHGIHGATGGGVSLKFERPHWQQPHAIPPSPAGTPGRGVPDVAGPADPHCGCEIIVGGSSCVSAGTSAVAPLWAALIACANAKLNLRAGFITPLLYELAHSTGKPLRDIVEGDNGFYKAGPGWNACTGLGSPIIDKLLSSLAEQP